MRLAQAEADGLAAQLAAADPERNKKNGAQVQPLQEAAHGDFRAPLLILQGAVGLVLLIGSANVGGLLLARAASRCAEIAIRTALGADRWRTITADGESSIVDPGRNYRSLSFVCRSQSLYCSR